MKRFMLKSKLHGAVVKKANLDYEGSITIDRELAELADMLQGEKVQVLDMNNGVRFETYVIYGEKGQVELNGAAARLVYPGDKLLILSYALYDEDELKNYRPRIIILNEKNEVEKIL